MCEVENLVDELKYGMTAAKTDVRAGRSKYKSIISKCKAKM